MDDNEERDSVISVHDTLSDTSRMPSFGLLSSCLPSVGNQEQGRVKTCFWPHCNLYFTSFLNKQIWFSGGGFLDSWVG